MTKTDAVSIAVLRTADGARGEVSLPLTATLDSLKAAILRCPALPTQTRTPAASSNPKPQTIPEMYGIGIKSQMRLFHLGRELKSSGRSLGALGIGRFDNYLVHLAAGGVADGKANGGGASSGRKRKAARASASGSGSGSGGGTTVEMIDSSDDDDDDDDEVIELDDSQESSAGGKTPAAAASAASSSSGGGGGGPGEVIDLLDDSDDDDDAVGGAGGTSGAAAGKRQRA